MIRDASLSAFTKRERKENGIHVGSRDRGRGGEVKEDRDTEGKSQKVTDAMSQLQCSNRLPYVFNSFLPPFLILFSFLKRETLKRKMRVGMMALVLMRGRPSLPLHPHLHLPPPPRPIHSSFTLPSTPPPPSSPRPPPSPSLSHVELETRFLCSEEDLERIKKVAKPMGQPKLLEDWFAFSPWDFLSSSSSSPRLGFD